MLLLRDTYRYVDLKRVSIAKVYEIVDGTWLSMFGTRLKNGTSLAEIVSI